MDEQSQKQVLFQVFNEIGIIQQLAVTEFHRRMPEGLHVSHFSVINHLCRLGDGRTPMSIAQAFQVTKATMTNTLIKLSARGFIEVRENPADGRSKLVYLTETGRSFQEKAIAALDPVLSKMTDELDVDRIAGILPALEQLRSYMDNNRSA